MKNLFKTLFGDVSQKKMRELKSRVATVNDFESEIKKLSDEELRAKTVEFKKRLNEGASLDEILPEAFAVVRESAWRVMEMRHYDVQLIGGMVLHEGLMAEMRTGEGKTLTSTLPVYLNALEGKGAHVVTVNDYLARRDAQWMGQIYAFLGMTIGIINEQNQAFLYDASHDEDLELDSQRDEQGSVKVFYEFLRPCTKKEAYDADITYGTNNQFGFDYLRDNTVRRKEQLVQRGHHFAIVDEVDSILIDEARVPLILSTKSAEAENLYKNFAMIARQMQREDDYTVDEKQRAVELTDEGIEKAEKLLKIDNLFTSENIKLVHHLKTAVRANAVYQRDKDYVVKDDKVVIVDSFTGRMQDGRRWSDGLHQAVEAKENVTIQAESRTMASITYQNYFKFYTKLSGMTGTGESSEEEFRKVYGVDVIVIPTNKPIIRDDQADLIFQTEKGKFMAIAKRVKDLQKKGQPVLIGTVSVEKNELLSAHLTQEGVKHQVLNAKNHESEGQIIAQAGATGAVTIATNMAGRGVDIKLGGMPSEKEKEQAIKDLGGLYVIGTERHEARRIDNQLRGRSGRQGDPGATQFYVSLEDQLMRVFGAERFQGMIGMLKLPEDEAIQNKIITRGLEKAQEKIEGFHFDARKHTLSYDDVLSHHREIVYGRRKKILFDDKEYKKELYSQIFAHEQGLEKKVGTYREELGSENVDTMIKDIALSIIDRLWMEHLEVMSNTRQSVNLRAYGQREPIVEYKKESNRLFGQLESVWIDEIANILKHLDVAAIKKAQQARVTNQEQNNNEGEASPSENKEKNALQQKSDRVTITKGREVKEVKRKKVQQWLDAGWEVRA